MIMPQDRYIKIGDVNTRYWAEGDKGSNMILIHGLGASADIWMHNISALAKEIPCICPRHSRFRPLRQAKSGIFAVVHGGLHQ